MFYVTRAIIEKVSYIHIPLYSSTVYNSSLQNTVTKSVGTLVGEVNNIYSTYTKG